VSPETVAALFTGLTGLVAGLSAFTASRSRKVEGDQRVLRKRVRRLERQVLALVQHVFTLELEIARTGGTIPDRPMILEMLDHDGPEERDAPGP
jgi:hypothetical protein